MKFNSNYYTNKEKRTYLLVAFILITMTSVRVYIHHQTPNHHSSVFNRITPQVDKELPINNLNKLNQEQRVKKKQSEAKLNTTAYLLHASPFDPNEVGESELTKMKFPTKGIQNLLKYRAKGGSIKTVAQFKRIWGFEDIEESFLDTILLLPVPTNHRQFDTPIFNDRNKEKEKATFYIPKKTYSPKIVDINHSDTTELKSLKGIGSWRAMKLIEFREQLGGFHSIEQLSSVGWLPDSVYQSIKAQLRVDSTAIKQITINHSNLKELSNHPYINFAKARMLTNYIVEHGPLNDKRQLYTMRGLDSAFVEQILPYLDLSIDIDQNSF